MSDASSTATSLLKDMEPMEERATALGYIGLFPFLFTAISLWLSPSLISYERAGYFMVWGLYYGAIVISFLGGVRWGMAMMNETKEHRYIGVSQLTNSIIAPMIAWLTIVPNGVLPGFEPNYLVRFSVLLLAFAAMMQADMNATRDGYAPYWYGPMRRKLTMFLGLIFILILTRLFVNSW